MGPSQVDDLFAYFKFLRYKPYNDPAGFKELIKDKILHNPDNGYKILSIVLQAILLRRTKSTKLGDEPIVNLPPREQELIQPEFTAQEADFYKTVQEDGMRALEQNTKENGGKEQYVNMLYFLLKMRQACNHPWLVKGLGQRYTKGGSCRPASAAELAAARKLEPEQRARLLSLVQHPQAQCPVCADVPEDPVVATCGHVYCQQCAAAQLEGAGHEDEFLCSSCSVVLRSSSLFSAAALQGQQPQQSKPAAPPKGGSKKGGGAASSCLGSDAPWTTSTKVDQLMQLLHRVLIKQGAGGASQPPSTPAGPSAGTPNPYRSKVSSKMAKMFKPLGPPLPAQQLPGSKAGGGAAASGGPPGAAKGPRKDKVIVFSQWTSMLDLLELPLGAARFNFRRLDGTMSVAQRERAIIDFEDQPDVLVLLVSLKAAALGVNLTCANHVVLMDLWWNPTVEEQAIDRAHRIGECSCS
ncbi:P-loop containing nucleoside triphosphate hydrolase protein [Dunaliella salina]|uniref:P-loop containing nucleoside triphosphate hydrolase protein n=1 Tax=Dunaliella salina TaxID=3046 RepID=A0ABQ7H938_DUNSA|nr:P-loop containing nucleoside triphosphate hydrolase protein [Dunaliella salina]|eukprot:KAF5843373.1 P-loop containing nucleoside triphosphate hydrolase protein [Dunaliella salina]